MDAIKATSVASVQLVRRHGSLTDAGSPLARPTKGSLHLTTHHAIFEATEAVADQAQPPDRPTASAGSSREELPTSAREIWIPLSTLHAVTRAPPSLTGEPAPIVLRTRLYETFELAFSSLSDADNVWDTLKGLCAAFSAGGLENQYAFFCKDRPSAQDGKGKGEAGWDIYDPAAEFARMGLGTRSKAWRVTSLNADFQFCPSYPAEIVVPVKISDTTLSYAVKYRSKSRIPGLVYLHWANLGSITRSSQPMVGITQNARSIQDEKLVEAIFASHGQHSHKLSPSPSSDGSPIYSMAGLSSPDFVYGSTATNVIIDARPTKNAYANSVKGAGTENMSFYKNCRKEYLGIDNIHVMRASLNGIFDALAEADLTGHLDRSALRRTHWLSHLTNILEGVLIVVRTIHLSNSHVLVHCSDGWDRTSQLSALPQICLDPYFRTARGLAVLIEKDWISYGHRFADRSGHLCDDRVEFAQKLGTDASTQQAFLASVTRQFASSSHAFKETCPVFQQFLDCIYQLQRQYPDRFEWNETLLRHLVRETYEASTGSFLFNSEKDRAAFGARTRTSSVWESVFDADDAGNLSLKAAFRNERYNPVLDDPTSKAVDADLGVLLFDPQDVKWWYELFGRTDDEMNAKPFAQEVVAGSGASPEPGVTPTEHKVVESAADDPVTNGLVAKTASLVVSAGTAPLAAVSSAGSASSLPLARSTSPASGTQPDRLASVQKLGWSAWKSVRKFGEDAARQLKEQQQQAAAARAATEADNAANGTGGGMAAPLASDDWAARATSFGGGVWSKLSSGNPWLAEGQESQSMPVRRDDARTPTSSRPSQDLARPPAAAERADPVRPPVRHPSSSLSSNPWETVTREEAIAPSHSLPPPVGLVESGISSRTLDPLGVGSG